MTTTWNGCFYLRQDGQEYRAPNRLLPRAQTLIYMLLIGRTMERLLRLRLVTEQRDVIATRVADFQLEDGVLRSSALFESSDVKRQPAYVQIVSTRGQVYAEAEAPSGITIDQPIEVVREDTITLNTSS